MNPDFEAEGMLEGLPDEAACAARLELLEDLHDRGVPLEQLRAAVEESRLALLPAEIALGGGAAQYTLEEAALRAGVEEELLARVVRALGLPVPPPGEASLTDEDVEAARRVRAALDSGLPADRHRQVSAVLGRGMAQLAGAVQALVGEAALEPGADELTVARRFEAVARELGPMMEPALGHTFRRHLREQLRHAAITQTELDSGSIPGAQEVAVCFVDIVGFTRLGEQVPAEELGEVVDRLEALALASVDRPARLVKTIGDAVMLVSTDGADAVIDGALSLIEAGAAESSDFPPLRAGVAAGLALGRAGDWYGPPVNLASRVTAVARPDSVLVTAEVRELAAAEWNWSHAGRRRLKGVPQPVALHRARRAKDGSRA